MVNVEIFKGESGGEVIGDFRGIGFGFVGRFGFINVMGGVREFEFLLRILVRDVGF